MAILNDSRMRWAMPQAITAVRLLLAAPFALYMSSGERRAAWLAGIALVLAIVTDFLDGYVARRSGVASAAGGTFDHSVDFTFVMAGLVAGAARGAFPWILPALIAAAFAQYFADSRWVHRQRGMRGSRLGRINGILYFVPLCMDVTIRLGAGFLRPVLKMVAWALVVSTLASMIERLALKPRS